MDRKAMLFPGQGAQFPGMGKDFCTAFSEADEIFARAGEALDFDLRKICFEGSEAEVNRTDICQPAILTTSIAILTVLEKRFGLQKSLFSATAGLSLGEYTALVFADVLTFEDAVTLVGKRGRYMQEDSDRNPSGMISLIGASGEQAKEIAAACAGSGVLVAANFLGQNQTVISGSLDALDEAESRLKEFGVRRGIRTKVAGAFHSPLMAEGGRKLKADLDATEFRKPMVPFASNVTGSSVTAPEEIRDCLAKQVTAPVLWHDTMKHFISSGVTAFFEPGPGRVLTGLVKKADRKLLTHNLDEPGGIDSFVSGYKEEARVADALSSGEGGGLS